MFNRKIMADMSFVCEIVTKNGAWKFYIPGRCYFNILSPINGVPVPQSSPKSSPKTFEELEELFLFPKNF